MKRRRAPIKSKNDDRPARAEEDGMENGFTYRRRARYHETDQMGVVHHSNYVKWMEEARIEFMDAMGFGYKRMEQAGIVSPVVGVSVEYKRPVEFDDTVEVRVKTEGYNGVVMEISYEIINATKGVLSASARSKHCFLVNGRPVSLKKALPEGDEALRRMMDGQ